jgi:transcriptional regulator of aromatic amino acid metabolism
MLEESNGGAVLLPALSSLTEKQRKGMLEGSNGGAVLLPALSSLTEKQRKGMLEGSNGGAVLLPALSSLTEKQRKGMLEGSNGGAVLLPVRQISPVIPPMLFSRILFIHRRPSLLRQLTVSLYMALLYLSCVKTHNFYSQANI